MSYLVEGEYLARAERNFLRIQSLDDRYREVAHWHPVCPRVEDLTNALDWLEALGYQRGTPARRNDFLYPGLGLVIIRDPRVATMFKLVWA